MNKLIIFSIICLTFFLFPSHALAATSDISKIQTFMQSIVQLLIAISGVTAVIFIGVGGFKYITSSGNPQKLEQAKETIINSAIGLAVVLGSFVLSDIVTELATQAFGAMK